MIDTYVLLTPILMLPIVALLAFIGCSYNPPRVVDTTSPLVPVLTAVAGDGKVTLSWLPDINADKFQVKRGEAAGERSVIREVLVGAAFIDTTVVNGTEFFYVVTAWQGQTETAESNEVAVTPVGPVVSVPQPFVTGETPGTLISAQGSFGMTIQVGSSDLTITRLGRLFITGNGQMHTVQIIDSAGIGVPGGFVTVNMAGGTAGLYQFAPLPPQIFLDANTRYFVVSQEMSGGDDFLNHTTMVDTTTDATVTG
ncbi:MAG: hypothetical protein ABIR58_04480, partial [Gemmatimonadaceae bacterium]